MTTRSKAAWAVLALSLPAAAVYLAVTAATAPLDSPVARMYRTETNLTALRQALQAYRAAYGALPPGGAKGLERAAAALDRKADYLPHGPVQDAWGNAFVYEAHGDSFRLYSRGADTAEGAGADDITSWQSGKPWRRVYREMHRRYIGGG